MATVTSTAPAGPIPFRLDSFTVEQFAARIRAYGSTELGYVVTPNVDHFIRYCDEPEFRAAYDAAQFVVLDSQFLAHVLALTRRLQIGVCPGSDLTQYLFDHEIRPTDHIVVVGAQADQVQELTQRYGCQITHINPPMGFIRDPAAVEACLTAVEQASPFRFCFIAVGTPQGEFVAHRLRQRDRARGFMLCVGASINFVTQREQRAPKWMRRIGCEWLYRLLSQPRRLAGRYLVRGPQIFRLLPHIRIDLREVGART